jgi:hypothetical protein
VAKTLAQKAADRQLDEAVERYIEAYKMLGDGVQLVDYVMVMEGVELDQDGEIDGEGYGLGFRHGNARTSVALGLFHKGIELLQFGSRVEEIGD